MLAFVLGYSVYIMVHRVKRANCRKVDEAKADVVEPSNLPKRLLLSFGNFIVSSLRLMASLVPYPVFLLAYIKAMEDVFNIGFKFLHATWSDEWALGIRLCLSRIGKDVQGLSNDFLRLVLAPLAFIIASRILIMLLRIRGAGAGACCEGDAKVVVVGPNNPSKPHRRSLCAFLVPSLRRMVFSFAYLAFRPITTVVHALRVLKLVSKGIMVFLLHLFLFLVIWRAAVPPLPVVSISSAEVTSPVEVASAVQETSSPVSDPSKDNTVDLQTLRRRYGEVKKVAGSRQ
ncbi:hypothetical protein FRC02_007456, partial [Tulasnella sp. 418]